MYMKIKDNFLVFSGRVFIHFDIFFAHFHSQHVEDFLVLLLRYVDAVRLGLGVKWTSAEFFLFRRNLNLSWHRFSLYLT